MVLSKKTQQIDGKDMVTVIVDSDCLQGYEKADDYTVEIQKAAANYGWIEKERQSPLH